MNAPTPNPEPTLTLPVAVERRLKGKIAALPKAQRETINHLLLDGATYATVIQRMADQGVELNAENVSNWYQTGYQSFLAHLERSDFHRSRYEAATELLQDTDTSRLPQAGLQTAAAQIYDLLGHFTATAVAQNIADDADKYTRIINSLSRLARETLALQKYQDVCARARAALHELKDPKRKLNESETRAIVLKVDDILGLSSDDDSPDLDSPDPQPPPAPPNEHSTAA